MMGLEGNKDPEEPEKVQNTRYLVILDDRKYGRTARIPLFYDVDTGILAEPPEGFLEDESCQTLTEWYNMHPLQQEEKGKENITVAVHETVNEPF